MASAGFISWVDSNLYSSFVWIGEPICQFATSVLSRYGGTVVLRMFLSLAFVHEKDSERFRL